MSAPTPASTAHESNAANRKRARHRYQARQADSAYARWMKARREDARSHGYRGPLTREEASAMALAMLADLAAGR